MVLWSNKSTDNKKSDLKYVLFYDFTAAIYYIKGIKFKSSNFTILSGLYILQ